MLTDKQLSNIKGKFAAAIDRLERAKKLCESDPITAATMVSKAKDQLKALVKQLHAGRDGSTSQ